MRTFDWRPKPDPRSANFRFAAIPMCSSLTARASVMRTKAAWLDQGTEGACTGFGEEHVRALTPYPQQTSNEVAQRIYHEARRQDEWEGEDYEGSSVNGAMKAARLLGLVKSWKWAATIEEAKHGLSYHGAGEAGTWWYDGMFEPDDNGFIHPLGQRVGGHAYAIAGYGVHNGLPAFRMENSWGHSWGDNGGAWITVEGFTTLLFDGGELAFPTKVRL